jgi:hypothetical protein
MSDSQKGSLIEKVVVSSTPRWRVSRSVGDELAVGDLEVGDAGDELGVVGFVDFGSELRARPLSDLVALATESAVSDGPNRGPR